MPLRIGSGFDAHALVENRPLRIGGVLIPAIKGSSGHSDGDVLIHALCDALLGALNLGDLGMMFPSTNNDYRDKNSTYFLEEIMKIVRERKVEILNVDITVILQEPKISAYIPKMKDVLCPVLGIHNSHLSIKSKTTDHLGFTGRSEGLAAECVLLLNLE